jgi:peroxiredoxin family protein
MTADRTPLGVILLDGSHAKAHFAFAFAAAAAAMDRPVTLFASGAGLGALCRDWTALSGAADDALLVSRGVAGLDVLREAALALDVRLLACEAALRGQAIAATALIEGVRIAGIATFLADLRGAQLVSF